MGIVSETVRERVRAAVNQHGVVVWFDPERRFAGMMEHFTLPECQIYHYTDSFFALRHSVDPMLNDELPPHIVIYVPLAEAGTHNALIELISAGVTMAPDAPAERCTNLAVIARE